MPSIVDPDSILPDRKASVAPSKIILFLIYPVIFILGLAIGIVIGVKQGQASKTNSNQNVNQTTVNTSIVPNANTRVNANVTTANSNVSNVFLNTNSTLGSGDYLQIDAATQSSLAQQEQKDKDTLVDQTASLTDVIRQRDLIALKYNLKAYYVIHSTYPSTAGHQIRLTRSDDNGFLAAMKSFYGSGYNLVIDPESPTYYYGYSSDGTTFELTAYLVSKSKAFILKSTP